MRPYVYFVNYFWRACTHMHFTYSLIRERGFRDVVEMGIRFRELSQSNSIQVFQNASIPLSSLYFIRINWTLKCYWTTILSSTSTASHDPFQNSKRCSNETEFIPRTRKRLGWILPRIALSDYTKSLPRNVKKNTL